MPARLIKIGKDGLVGRVLAYVKEPNENGTHDAVIAASSVPEFIQLYMQFLEKEETPESQEFLATLGNADTHLIGPANCMITLDNICSLKEKYDCDIIEIYPRETHGMCAPQPVQEGIRDACQEFAITEMHAAIDNYFSAYENAVPNADPFPTYKDCNREEWKDILFEVHESLVNPQFDLDYELVERDLQRLCSGSGVPAKIISDMCYIAKNGFKEKIKLLRFYKELILAIEDKRYEDAALLKQKINKLKE